ncbi:hypothetical protein PUN28_001152 [Cardiocondyla obscurior]|uniref:Uncharacterized protein n=1 Tax=Cardiocondyla obscurior TaxID=286306 RepID=A0AAW2H3G1_9HYME
MTTSRNSCWRRSGRCCKSDPEEDCPKSQLRCRNFLHHEKVGDGGDLGDALDEVASLHYFVRHLSGSLGEHVQRELLRREHRVELLQQLLLALVQHRSVKLEGVVDLILRLVVLNLQDRGVMVRRLDHRARIRRLRAALLDDPRQCLQLLRAHLRNVRAIV